MREKTAVIFCLILSLFAADGFAGPSPDSVIKTNVAAISVEQQYKVVKPGGKSALAVRFELKKDWHFYASAETAPGGMNLKVEPGSADHINFLEPVFPEPELYFDKSLGKKLEVFSGGFTVFLPFSVSEEMPKPQGAWNASVTIKIDGAVCSDVQCRVPDFADLGVVVKIAPDAVMANPKFTLPESVERGGVVLWGAGPDYSMWFALGLAFLAGLSLNIMPCVWPVLPLIVMRIVKQGKESRGKAVTLGLAFCFGILLFFAGLAGANIILQVFYGTVLQWGDQFRSPAFVAGMALLLVVLALFMFDVFTISVPASAASKSGSGKGYSGAVGMGFLAAVLSTPCSFAILAAAFAWAQAQPLLPATAAIMIIGIGMAVPYAILTSIPGLLKRLPRSGRWMELFKHAVGFVLLIIAVKLIGALPGARKMGVLYFAVVLGFCVWMWSDWVAYNTKPLRKWLIRVIAAALAISAGWLLLGAPAAEQISWKSYDADLVETARAEGEPVLIKFTADWCLSCQVVDRMVYSREDVAKLIEEKDVLAIKADTTTRDSSATFALKSIYNEPGVPVTLLFMPGNKEPVRWHGMSFAGELKQLLKQLPDKN